MLIHFAGERVYDIYSALPDLVQVEDEEALDEYETAKTQLNLYFSPKKNTEYERYMFRQTREEHGEALDQFHNRLRQLAATCEFNDRDKELKSLSF